ncbi:MAG: hypothetical protein ABEK12_01960, partial [Candidatus Nanohaloarchaea archaeon]
NLPLLSQEVRFYTYTLLVGSIVAGLGAARVHARLADRLSGTAATAALLLPVVLLSVHAGLPATWTFHGDVTPLTDALADRPTGRVIAETSNRSRTTSYVVPARVLMDTRHAAVNDVHLDATSAANYIL